MAVTGRTFRIFVSSTFSDLKEERNALQERVFPKLRELCMQHGCRFQAIDLRWGVSEEAALDQQTMKICMEEIKRCQRLSPRPNFIVLLGDRYGWQPLPYEIPANEFEEIERLIANPDDKNLLSTWYRRDDNAVPPVYCLLSREGEYEDFTVWDKVEKQLLTILRRAVSKTTLNLEARLKYFSSATEQEIVRGAMTVPDAKDHVFCFLRSLRTMPEGPLAKEFIDLDENCLVDDDAQNRLKTLKDSLRKALPGNVHEYEADWGNNSVTGDHLENLCKDVYEELSGIITREIGQLQEIDPLDKEIADHWEFAEERARHFIGRGKMIDTVMGYLRRNDKHLLAIHGEGGSGKSALMAHIAQKAGQEMPDTVVMLRHIGATPSSSDGRSLLESLCRQIYKTFNFEKNKQQKLSEVQGQDEEAQKKRKDIESEYEIPSEYQKLSMTFRDMLTKIPAANKLIIFIDALDQLSDADHARSLVWLPSELPEHVSIVISTLTEDESRKAIERKLTQASLIQIDPMPEREGEALLDLWLKDANRTLQVKQSKDILHKFRQCGLPLYLKLAFEEAIRWKSYDGLPKGADDKPGLSEDIPGIIRDLFWRLSQESNHGNMLVSRSLGYLAASRNGLTEDEMLDVLSRDEEVISDFFRRSPKSPTIKQLPVVVWSRLYFDLAPYLTERNADGTSLMTFYHRQLGEAVKEDYLSGEAKPERHCYLAEYFGNQPHWITTEETKTPNIRKMSEFPYQQTYGEMWDDVEKTLTDLLFIEAKCAGGMTYDLVADYNRVGVGWMRSGPPIRTACFYKDRIGVYCPFCLVWHEIEKEQLNTIINCPACDEKLKINPFVIEAEWRPSITQRELKKTISMTSIHFSKTVSEFADFVRSQAFILAKHPELVFQQASNQPNKTAPAKAARKKWLSGQEKRTWLKLVNKPKHPDLCIMTLVGHSGYIKTCTYSMDGRWIVSGGYDKTIKKWNAETGAEIFTSAVFPAQICACAYSPDGQRIVVGLEDGMLKELNAETGEEINAMVGHSNIVSVCTYSPDGLRIASASRDKTLKIWESKTGVELDGIKNYKFKDLAKYLLSAPEYTFSPDGRWIVSWFADIGYMRSTLMVFNIDTEEGIDYTLSGILSTCAYSPDGRRIVVGLEDGVLKELDAETGKEISIMVGHSAKVLTCTYSPDGLIITSGSLDKTIKVWKANTGKKVSTIDSHSGAILTCSFSPDGRRIASGSTWPDNTLKVWGVKSGKVVVTVRGHKNAIRCCTYSPDGRWILSGGHDVSLKKWDAKTGAEIDTIYGREDCIRSCAYTPDGQRMILSLKRTFRVLDSTTDKKIFDLEGHKGLIRYFAFSPDGRWLVSASWDDNTLMLWDLQTGVKTTDFCGHTGAVFTCAYSPDGMRIVSGGEDQNLKIWNVQTGDEVVNLTGHSSAILACAYSPDGRVIISASEDGTVRMWDVLKETEVSVLRGHYGRVFFCKYTLDGKKIISASWDGMIKIWDVQTKEEKASFICKGKLFSLALGEIGRHIAIGDNSGKLDILYIEGCEFENPIVTPVHLYNFNHKNWDKQPTTKCEYCGQRFPVSDKILDVIRAINRNANLSPDQSPCLELPDEAWEEPRLLSECPHCRKPLRFNPFIVDNRDRY